MTAPPGQPIASPAFTVLTETGPLSFIEEGQDRKEAASFWKNEQASFEEEGWDRKEPLCLWKRARQEGLPCFREEFSLRKESPPPSNSLWKEVLDRKGLPPHVKTGIGGRGR